MTLQDEPKSEEIQVDDDKCNASETLLSPETGYGTSISHSSPEHLLSPFGSEASAYSSSYFNTESDNDPSPHRKESSSSVKSDSSDIVCDNGVKRKRAEFGNFDVSESVDIAGSSDGNKSLPLLTNLLTCRELDSHSTGVSSLIKGQEFSSDFRQLDCESKMYEEIEKDKISMQKEENKHSKLKALLFENKSSAGPDLNPAIDSNHFLSQVSQMFQVNPPAQCSSQSFPLQSFNHDPSLGEVSSLDSALLRTDNPRQSNVPHHKPYHEDQNQGNITLPRQGDITQQGNVTLSSQGDITQHYHHDYRVSRQPLPDVSATFPAPDSRILYNCHGNNGFHDTSNQFTKDGLY